LVSITRHLKNTRARKSGSDLHDNDGSGTIVTSYLLACGKDGQNRFGLDTLVLTRDTRHNHSKDIVRPVTLNGQDTFEEHDLADHWFSIADTACRYNLPMECNGL
jgi:hypothetical protein